VKSSRGTRLTPAELTERTALICRRRRRN
jgi:hypothetical protein